jgi:hypothetical protein
LNSLLISRFSRVIYPHYFWNRQGKEEEEEEEETKNIILMEPLA